MTAHQLEVYPPRRRRANPRYDDSVIYLRASRHEIALESSRWPASSLWQRWAFPRIAESDRPRQPPAIVPRRIVLYPCECGGVADI